MLKHRTKNLFDNSLLLNASDWALNSDGYYTGGAAALYTYLRNNPITGFKENTVYTIKGTGYAAASTVNFRFKLNYSDGTNSTLYFNDLTATTKSYTSDSNKSLTSITSDYGSTGVLYLKELMIVEGSTAPTEYIPYLNTPHELYKKNSSSGYDYIGEMYKKSPNLFDRDSAVLGAINATTGAIITSTYHLTSDFISVLEGDILNGIGTVNKVGSTERVNVSGWIKAYYDSNKTFISGSRGAFSMPLTIPSNVAYIRIESYYNSITSSDTIDKDNAELTIVKSATAPTEYIAYGYQHVFSAGYDTEVVGNPATMSNARAKSLAYTLNGNSKRTINTTDGTTYTVPDEYTMVEYLQNNGANCKIRTGIVPSVEECEYYCRFYAADTESLYLFTSRGGSTQGSNQFGISGSVTGGTITFRINTTTLTSGIARTVGHIYQVKGTCTSDGAMTLYVKDETSGTEDTVTKTLSSWTAAQSQIDLFANEYGDYLTKNYKIYEAYHKEAGVKKLHIVAAKNSSDILGMYDFVSDTFFTNASSGTFTAGNELPTPDNNLGVKSTGDISKNLFDITTAKDGYFVRAGNATTENPLGSEGASSTWSCSDYIPVSPSTTYTVTYPYYQSATAAGLVYFSDKTVASAISGVTTNTQGSTVYTFTTPATCNYVRISWNHSQGNNCQLEVGSSSTTIVPHYQFPLTRASDCGKVDMGTLTWSYEAIGSQGQYCMRVSTPISDMDYGTQSAISDIGDIYCYGYTPVSYNTIASSSRDDMLIARYYTGSGSKFIYIANSNYTDPVAFKQAVSGKYLYYKRTTDTSWTAPTTYTIYDDSQLMKIGTYADTIESDGIRTNNIGVKVLDGTESWTYDSSYRRFRIIINDVILSSKVRIIPGYCTHFQILSNEEAISSVVEGQAYFGDTAVTKYMYFHTSQTSVSDWTTWLAAQYAVGTPVTIWYPLATATTETVTTPNISTVAGTNYLECTTTIPVSELSATYRKKTK